MAKKRSAKAAPTALTERVELRMSKREKRTFQKAAASQGISLSQWLRLACWKITNEHDGKVTLVDLEK
jgi:predicted HicB family RNase H-like nuclease